MPPGPRHGVPPLHWRWSRCYLPVSGRRRVATFHMMQSSKLEEVTCSHTALPGAGSPTVSRHGSIGSGWRWRASSSAGSYPGTPTRCSSPGLSDSCDAFMSAHSSSKDVATASRWGLRWRIHQERCCASCTQPTLLCTPVTGPHCGSSGGASSGPSSSLLVDDAGGSEAGSQAGGESGSEASCWDTQPTGGGGKFTDVAILRAANDGCLPSNEQLRLEFWREGPGQLHAQLGSLLLRVDLEVCGFQQDRMSGIEGCGFSTALLFSGCRAAKRPSPGSGSAGLRRRGSLLEVVVAGSRWLCTAARDRQGQSSL